MSHEYYSPFGEGTKHEVRSWFGQQILDVIRVILQTIMEFEMMAKLQAKPYERSEKRQGHRNGYRERSLHTRMGKVQLKVPRCREGTFETAVFDRYRRMEPEIENTLIESYLSGISTRKISNLTEALCDLKRSPSAQSKLNKRIEEHLHKWRNRPLEGEYPYLFVDGAVIATRWAGEVKNVSVLFAVGINQDGYREVLGVYTGYQESEES